LPRQSKLSTPRRVDSVKATRASNFLSVWFGVLPQVVPQFVAFSLYRWDINIRMSLLLGFVGAGGIGILLYSSVNQFLWREVSVILISVFIVVVISEFISAAVRERST